MVPYSQSAAARIIKISSRKIEAQKMRLIADTLRQGGVVAYPTDTFYGLGATIFSVPAVKRIYRIKKREESRPMPVLVSDFEMAKSLAGEIPPMFSPITTKFWPGSLTIVVKAAARLPDGIVGPNRTIGIRLPNVPWLRKLIRQVGFPIIATSANISGAGEIDSPEEVIRQFKNKVDLIVDGGRTPGRRPSTVVDLTGERPIILRQGVISKTALKKLIRAF